MAQFDIYTLGETQMRFVDLQSGAVDTYNTRLLAPLVPANPNLKPLRRVNREIVFEGKTYFLMPQLMASVRTRELGNPIGNISDQRDGIVSALDVLFLGV